MGGGCLIFLPSSLENHFPAGLPSSHAPVRSLAGRNQEQRFIPTEMPDGATQWCQREPESETPRHEEHAGTPAEGTRVPRGDPSGCRCITGWGRFQRGPGLGAPPCPLSPPTPAVGAPKHPISPQTPNPPPPLRYSFTSQLQLPAADPWEMGEDNVLPSSPAFGDGLCSLEELRNGLHETKCPRLGGLGVFRGALAINPCKGVKTNQRWLGSPQGSRLLRLDPSSEQEQGKWERRLQMWSLESCLSVHGTAGHRAPARRGGASWKCLRG